MAENDNRVIAGKEKQEDSPELSLRPERLSEMIGQTRVKDNLQILIEAGLLPGALIINKNIKFISRQVSLNINSYNSIFTEKISKEKKIIKMPIAHKQGNYIAEKNILKELEDNDQIIFKYSHNPNGSISNILFCILFYVNKFDAILFQIIPSFLMQPHLEFCHQFYDNPI